MIADRLRAKGVVINDKHVERLWRETGLSSFRPRRTSRKGARRPSLLAAPSAANERLALDFVSDRLANGHAYRMLAVIDVFTRECLAIDLGRSMPASRVVAILDRIAAVRGLPRTITTDNGPEFINTTLDRWARTNGVQHSRSRPGTPTDNPFIESFNARLRAECVDLWWTESIREGQASVDAWRHRYNRLRPHGSLGRRTPNAFAATAPWIAFRALDGQKTSERRESQSQNQNQNQNNRKPLARGQQPAILSEHSSTASVP